MESSSFKLLKFLKNLLFSAEHSQYCLWHFIKYQLSKLWWNSIFFREKLHFNEIDIWSKFELYWWITNSWNIDLKEKLSLPYILCPIFYQQYTNTSCFQTKIRICNFNNTFIIQPTNKNRLQRHLQFKIMYYLIKPYNFATALRKNDTIHSTE